MIQCEGRRTEQQYLDGFFRENREALGISPTVKPGSGGDARATVQAALTERNRYPRGPEAYDEVCCVLDVEDISRAVTLTEALEMADRAGITVYLSNPSFEVWLLAHFGKPTRHFPDSRAVEEYLQHNHWRRHFQCDYDKADPKLYDKLAARIDDAVENAEWTLTHGADGRTCRERNSSTEVGRLIVRMRSAP